MTGTHTYPTTGTYNVAITIVDLVVPSSFTLATSTVEVRELRRVCRDGFPTPPAERPPAAPEPPAPVARPAVPPH